jgi:RNA polymerase sigma factor (sigma-70 family)
MEECEDEKPEAVALVYKALVTGLRDYFRKNGRRKTENLEDAPEPSAVDEYEILKNPINKEVYRLLEQLSQEERELLTMIYVQELKNPQIGEILGINAKAVSERHRRLLAKLRAMEKGKESGDYLDFS